MGVCVWGGGGGGGGSKILEQIEKQTPASAIIQRLLIQVALTFNLWTRGNLRGHMQVMNMVKAPHPAGWQCKQ